jgi:hypothetical protein
VGEETKTSPRWQCVSHGEMLAGESRSVVPGDVARFWQGFGQGIVSMKAGSAVGWIFYSLYGEGFFDVCGVAGLFVCALPSVGRSTRGVLFRPGYLRGRRAGGERGAEFTGTHLELESKLRACLVAWICLVFFFCQSVGT